LTNQWNIPSWLEKEIIDRDKHCVYCQVELIDKVPKTGSRKTVASWEHIINDARIVTKENIARCCFSCNASKGAKILSEWMKSPYCQNNGITSESVAEVVKTALKAGA